MSNPIFDWVDSMLDAIRADAELRRAVNWEAVARAQTKLFNAKTELEMSQGQYAVVAELNRALQQSPELRQKFATIQLSGVNPFAHFPGGGGLPSAAPRQIVSSGSNNSNDDWG